MACSAGFVDNQGNAIPLPAELWEPLNPGVRTFILFQQEQIRLQQEQIRLQQEQIRLQQEQIRLLQDENQMLVARITILEEQLKLNSNNSSKPPSTDPPGTMKNRSKPSGKPRGGQKGRKGHHRELVPTEKADHLVEHRPDKCAGCGHSLAGVDALTSQEPVRHQVWDLPPVRAEVTEHQLHRCSCPGCGLVTLAQLPPEVPKGAFGPGLAALTGLLLGRYRLSRRQCESLLADGFGVTISLGGLASLEALVSQSLEAAAKAVQAAIWAAPVANVDDTGWKENDSRAVLWNINTPSLAFFMISARKDHETAKNLLGSFDGILGSDRAATYSFHPLDKQATCWAHLDRHFQRMEDRGGKSAATGTWGKAEVDRFFNLWHRFKRDEITRTQLQLEVIPIQARMGRLLRRGARCDHTKTEKTCRNLLKVFSSLWTCVHREGVEPTNNTSEQALRHPVQWRRTSFGTRSDEGSRFVERVLTITETCRRQGRDLLDFLTRSVKAQLQGILGPSLLNAPG